MSMRRERPQIDVPQEEEARGRLKCPPVLLLWLYLEKRWIGSGSEASAVTGQELSPEITNNVDSRLQ